MWKSVKIWNALSMAASRAVAIRVKTFCERSGPGSHEHDVEESEHPAVRQPMTDEELRQYLLRTGRISQLPTGDWKGQKEDHWKPIPVEGEPVSQTIIRERR